MYGHGLKLLTGWRGPRSLAVLSAFLFVPLASYFAARAIGDDCYVCLNYTVNACDCTSNGPCGICQTDGYCYRIFEQVCAQTKPHISKPKGAFLEGTQVHCWIRYYCGLLGNGTCSSPGTTCPRSGVVYGYSEDFVVVYDCVGICDSTTG